MNKKTWILGLILAIVPLGLDAQDAPRWDRVSVIQMPQTGARDVAELSDNPGYLYTPANERDPDGLSLVAAYNLVVGALAGVLQRQGGR